MTQFKVGDWVKCIDGSIQRIAEIDEKSEEIYYIDSDNELNSYFFSNVKSWQPKEGEWCWFWNENSLDDYPRLGKYGHLSWTLEYWDYCEPFTGQLPSWIKDSK